ncbi:tRNA pseudouridine(38-40) synthase TruA [Naumannella sp. ID2617S]|uniref:tRNA pseudouridine synthase A n=1 Tax=Enemella dayhoffiae TaxID=2016507 RepID=A0A255H8M3_9ACTN|nr:tRNA pseudouridine(38-40) synthase TruA [Enemella dayhoffiae]NNG18146.1 tRNA pseudouridine(38-40) synthase TruA [Naumannella sp. ID2617S]OYO23931.1 tRNA pseudouridine(38-40) synthase TruA [Enemella dayhoffiae]
MSTRWRLDISYHGREFSGWAAQRGRRTVQGVLEHWITQVLRLDEPAALVCAGRTDAGVHARGQVAHLDLPTDWPEVDQLQRRLSRVLPRDVVVRRVAVAPADFDARFGAVWRRYVYRFDDSGAPDPLLADHVLAVRHPLDVEAMNAAAEPLIGLHDFAAFCKRREGATTIRTLLELRAVRHQGRVEFTVRADAFCHSMVRSLMGAMTTVGGGRRDAEWLRSVLATPHRANTVPVLPAHGLCLEEVGYPADDQLAARADRARSKRETSDE